MTPTVRSAAGSDIGRRRAVNQDSAYTSSRLLAVADGMGGHAHGEIASAVAINAVADETLGPDDLMPRLRIDGDLTFRAITGGVAAGVAALAPFGAGNPRPVFAARGVEIIDGPRKLKERHLKMALKQEGRIFRAIAWRAAERHDFLAGHKTALDVAFSLDQNQYNGETYVELTLADVRSSEPHILTSSPPPILTSS